MIYMICIFICIFIYVSKTYEIVWSHVSLMHASTLTIDLSIIYIRIYKPFFDSFSCTEALVYLEVAAGISVPHNSSSAGTRSNSSNSSGGSSSNSSADTESDEVRMYVCTHVCVHAYATIL
jgi:hypothetical protein